MVHGTACSAGREASQATNCYNGREATTSRTAGGAT